MRLLPLLVLLAMAGGCTDVGRPTSPSPAATASVAAPDGVSLDVPRDGPRTVTTTSLTGNRTAAGRLDLDRAPLVLDAGFVPTVLLGAPVQAGLLLVAADDVQSATWVVTDDGTIAAGPDLGAPGPGRPALVRDDDRWRFAPSDALGDGDWTTDAGPVMRDGTTVTFGAATVDDLLPDARYAVAAEKLVVPVRPTDAYRHGVLGDEVEAGAIAVADATSGEVVVHDLPEGLVLEGTGALLVDLDGDGEADPVVTLSGPTTGAQQAVLLGDRFVLGPAIGQGNRWRHLLGAQDGTLLEIVTPHLARVYQRLQFDGDGFTVTASVPETIASHAIGSRDLDRAGLVDVTGDDVVDVLGPATDDDRVLLAVDGSDGSEVARLELPGVQSSNLATLPGPGDSALAAVGTSEGAVVLYGLDG